MSNDFMPPADDAFSHFINAFVTFATANPALLKIAGSTNASSPGRGV